MQVAIKIIYPIILILISDQQAVSSPPFCHSTQQTGKASRLTYLFSADRPRRLEMESGWMGVII
eukprot:scaffold167483_cov18-Prasinocladus_malaysianus.AAC.1